MKIIQLINQFGDHVGLYYTDRDDEKVEKDVEECFKMAKEISSMDNGVDERDAAETYLEERGISRIFAEEVFVDI
jgi:hypothetical protein